MAKRSQTNEDAEPVAASPRVGRRGFIGRIGAVGVGAAMATLGSAGRAEAVYAYRCCRLAYPNPSSMNYFLTNCGCTGTGWYIWTCCYNGTKWQCAECYCQGYSAAGATTSSC